MTDRRIAIVGCGAAGGTAAQFARKTDRKASITIFEKSKYGQYSKCGLPYAIGKTIPRFEDLLEYSAEWFAKEHVDLKTRAIVEAVDAQKKVLTAVVDGKRDQYEYDSLILATGAWSTLPPIEGVAAGAPFPPGVFCLRSMEDAVAIDKALAHASKAIIVGAGLIGLELAEALSERGLTVTVVEALPHILANTLDDDLCVVVASAVPATVTLLPYHFVTKVAVGTDHLSVSILNRETHAEQILEADIVVLATGTRPEVSVATALGCRIGVTGGVEVNARSETSIPDVYAAGDCTEYRELVTGEPVCIGLGSIAVRQGIAAGINAAGGSYELPAGVLLSRTSSVFGLEFAAVGPLLVHKHPRPVVHGKFTGSSRPTYFPGGVPITVKVGVEEESGRIVSAQAVGDQAAQRMNVYACAILKHMTVGEMQKLETTYAPPVAPTLDALTVACDVAALKRARKKR